MSTYYAKERKPEHSTVGDSYRALARDKDAFEAGAQYALDVLLRAVDDVGAVFGPDARDYLDEVAAQILHRAHKGEPQ